MDDLGVPRLLTPTETAELLGVTVQTLATWRSAQRYDLNYLLVGRRVMYDPADVRAWLESRRQVVAAA